MNEKELNNIQIPFIIIIFKVEHFYCLFINQYHTAITDNQQQTGYAMKTNKERINAKKIINNQPIIPTNITIR